MPLVPHRRCCKPKKNTANKEIVNVSAIASDQVEDEVESDYMQTCILRMLSTEVLNRTEMVHST